MLLIIEPEDLTTSRTEYRYYFTLCRICGHGARFDNIHLALMKFQLLAQAACNLRLS